MKYNNKKYKVVNAKVNKQLINDELELEPITSKKPPILQQILQHLSKIDNHLDKIDKDITNIKITLVEHGKLLKQHNTVFKEHGWIK